MSNNSGCTSCVAGYVTNNTDCCDSNAQINPGATYYTTAHAACAGVSSNWDYNCSGTITYAVDVPGFPNKPITGRSKYSADAYFRYGTSDCSGLWLGFDAQYLVSGDCGQGPYWVCDGKDPWVWRDGQVRARKSPNFGEPPCETLAPYWMTEPGVCSSQNSAVVKCR